MMNPKRITLVYFSPTNTTRTILEEIAKGIGYKVSAAIDITKSEIRSGKAPVFGDELTLIGAPVYAGRLPKQASDYLKTMKASGAPVIPVVVYGNREFEDALLELKNIATDAGFIPLAAAAFIGEHSFSSEDCPIAENRPDANDRQKAVAFGEQIAGLLSGSENPKDLPMVDVPGNFPYKEGFSMGPLPFIDVTDDCDGCDICVAACPENAIDKAAHYATIAKDCIFCCACIKACPVQARIMKEGPLKDKARFLSEKCALRKEPQVFIPIG